MARLLATAPAPMNRSTRHQFQLQRIHFVFLAIALVSALIIVRLFWLQVIKHNYYETIAQEEQYGQTTLPARRGEIRIEDYHTGSDYILATNTTLNMIFADPTLIDQPDAVAATLAPLLFDLETEEELDEIRYEQEWDAIQELENPVLREQALSELAYKNEEELFTDYQDRLEDTLSKRTRDIILIVEGLAPEDQDAIKALGLGGIEITDKGNLYAYPAEISNKSQTARQLAEALDGDSDQLATILEGKNRYTVLRRKLEPEVTQQIEAILEEDDLLEEPVFLGIGMREEYFRFYPEQELAAQILGFVDGAGNGQYGVEGTYNEILKGQDGIFTSQRDALGNQITVGETVIEQAVDGADITLTIDRAIQLRVEDYLSAGVRSYNADSGQAMVLDPETGAILAMAQYPSFNPNEYRDVYDLERIDITQEDEEFLYITGEDTENPRYWLYIQVDPDVRIELFPDSENPGEFYAYANQVGPEVYKNKMVQEVYEPGSIFKPIAMSAALNAGEVTPQTTFVDSGPLDVDYNARTGEYDFTIDNFDGQHHGVQTMTQVLEKSNNIGMAFVAQQLGSALFYSYLKSFGFTGRTDMGLDNEVVGSLEHYSNWTESELVTKAFGQGISMTPIQLAQAYTALANDGSMMRPYLVKEIEYATGGTEEFEPEIVKQVLTENSAELITAMLASVMDSYSSLAFDDHYAAGKSGTAQTYKWGKALSGPGTTIASFVGFAPVDDPQFLVVVKIDRPRTVEWGAATAGPIFHDIAEFLFDYYNIPPDKV